MVSTRTFALAVASLGSLAIHVTAQSCQVFSFESGVDYVGNDVATVKSVNADNCCTACANQPGCNAFTWTNYQGGTCWLKSSKGQTKPYDGAVGAFKPRLNSTSSCPILKSDVAYSGTNLANIRGIKTPADCCAECGKNPDCRTVGPTNPQPGSVSGARQVVNPLCPVLQADVAYSGTNLANIRGIKTPAKCCNECGMRSECTTFTWSPNSAYGGYCDLQKYNPGPGGAGLVECGDAPLSGFNNEHRAEYTGLITGLQAAKENHWTGLYIIGASELILRQLRDHRPPKNPTLLSLYRQARTLADQLDVREWNHHLRAHNRMANSLANFAGEDNNTHVFHPTSRPGHTDLPQLIASDLHPWLLRQSVGATNPQPGSVSGARQTINPSCPVLQSDVTYSGTDLAAIRAIKTPADCCAECTKNSQCAAFTWNPNTAYGGYCNLYKPGATVAVLSGAVSGSRVSPCGKIEENVDYVGNDIAAAKASKAEDCCSICQGTKGCGAYSWNNYNGGTCWLKSSKGATTANNGVRSAVVTRA